MQRNRSMSDVCAAVNTACVQFMEHYGLPDDTLVASDTAENALGIPGYKIVFTHPKTGETYTHREENPEAVKVIQNGQESIHHARMAFENGEISKWKFNQYCKRIDKVVRKAIDQCGDLAQKRLNEALSGFEAMMFDAQENGK